MAGKDIAGRVTKILNDLERVADASRGREGPCREWALKDIAAGSRREPGPSVSLEYFRMIRLLAWHDAFGGGGRRTMYASGEKTGRQLPVATTEELIETIHAMGLARAEIFPALNTGDNPGRIIIKFSESAVCSGIAPGGETLCTFESGLLAGALERIFGRKIMVTETKCVAVGYDYCQFEADLNERRQNVQRGLEEAVRTPGCPEYSGENIRLLSTLAAHAVSALENALLYEQTRKMVVTDSLTGTYNYGYFKVRLLEEAQRAERQNGVFSLVMIDIDGFKALNDRCGHPAGDGVLREFARVMKENVRGIDILCRYGGDEFVLLLPQTSAEEAGVVVERLRRMIEGCDFGPVAETGGPGCRVTASFGGASCPDDSLFPDQLLERADQALYEAKKTGRNKVCFAGRNQSGL